MEKVNAYISWSGNNYCATAGDQVEGCIIVTDKTFEGIQKAFIESLEFHIEGMVADGDVVPEYLENGDYEVVFSLETSALLRQCERYTSLAAIARASGINQRQLSHYARGMRNPRPEQRARIVEGLHKIGQEFLSVV